MSTLTTGRHEATAYVGADPATVAKALVYLVITIGGLPATVSLLGGDVTPASLVRFAIAVLGAVVVWRVPAGALRKAIAAGILAGLQALALVVVGVAGWSQVSLADWMGVIVAVLAALAVGITPNAPAIDAGTSTGTAGEVHLVTNVAAPASNPLDGPLPPVDGTGAPAAPWPGPDHPDDES